MKNIEQLLVIDIVARNFAVPSVGKLLDKAAKQFSPYEGNFLFDPIHVQLTDDLIRQLEPHVGHHQEIMKILRQANPIALACLSVRCGELALYFVCAKGENRLKESKFPPFSVDHPFTSTLIDGWKYGASDPIELHVES